MQVSDDVTISWMELLHRPVAAANALKQRCRACLDKSHL